MLERAANAVECDRWEKILQVGVYEHPPTGVFNCISANRTACDETVRGRMSGKALKDVLENPPLGGGQAAVRR